MSPEDTIGRRMPNTRADSPGWAKGLYFMTAGEPWSVLKRRGPDSPEHHVALAHNLLHEAESSNAQLARRGYVPLGYVPPSRALHAARGHIDRALREMPAHREPHGRAEADDHRRRDRLRAKVLALAVLTVGTVAWFHRDGR